MNAKLAAVLMAGIIALAAIVAVIMGKATFAQAATVVLPSLTGIFGLITDSDSVVNTIKKAIKRGESNVPKTS